MFVERTKLAEGVEAGIVTVVPCGLKRIAADEAEAADGKAPGAVADVGALDPAEDIGFAAAGRAGAGAAKFFERDITFAAIAPGHGKFMADDFGAKRVKLSGHEEKVSGDARPPLE
jgi:hypothetical protein